MSKVVGIDLGTTNSVIAVMEGGEPTVIPNAEGSRTTPSVVAFSKKEGDKPAEPCRCGPSDRQSATRAHDLSIKGIWYDYKVRIEVATITAGNRAMILQKLKADAEEYLGEKITKAVITVPATSRMPTRPRRAQNIAGSPAVINEPTAAALAYGSSATGYGAGV